MVSPRRCFALSVCALRSTVLCTNNVQPSMQLACGGSSLVCCLDSGAHQRGGGYYLIPVLRLALCKLHGIRPQHLPSPTTLHAEKREWTQYICYRACSVRFVATEFGRNVQMYLPTQALTVCILCYAERDGWPVDWRAVHLHQSGVRYRHEEAFRNPV